MDTLDLLNLLKQEIEENGREWTTLKKSQYIYKRLGELLSYDDRWLVTTNQKLKNKILNQEVNPTALTSNKMVCKAWSILYKDLLDNILKKCSDYKGTSINYFKQRTHYSTSINISNKIYIADINTSRDYAYIKKGIMPDDFKLESLSGREMTLKDKEEEQLIINNNFEELGLTKDKGYCEYLKLLKEELLSLKNIKGEYLQLNNKEFYKLYNFILKTTNFKDMNLGDAEIILHIIIKSLFKTTSQYNLDSIMLYRPKTDCCELLLSLPDGEGHFSNYVLTKSQDKLKITKLNINPIKYAKGTQYDKTDFKGFVTRQNLKK